MSGEGGIDTTPYHKHSVDRYGRVFWAALLVCLAAWTALHWYQTAIRIVDFYNPLPTWDYWRVVSDYSALKNFHFGVLWRQHNEHRILFPEIVFQIDMFLCHGRMLLPLILSSVCYACIYLIFSYCIWSEKALTPAMRVACILMTGGIIGWQGSACVLARPFLLQWTLSQLCVVLALLSLWGVHQTKRAKYLIGCVAFAVVGLYSSGNALVLWPILIAGALAIRIKRHDLYMLIVSGIVSGACYFVGYHSTDSLNLSPIVQHPVYALKLVAVYVAMPFSAIKSPMFGVWVGFINIALATALATALRKALATRLPVVLLGYYLFALLSAGLTVIGRMQPGDPLFVEAKAGRYLTTPLVNWAALFLLLIWTATRYHWRLVTPKAITLSVFLLCLLGFPKLRWWLAGNSADFIREKTAAIAVKNGVLDPIVLQMVFPDPGFVVLFIPMLHREHLSIFHAVPSGRS